MNAAKDASSTIASEEDIRDRSKDVTWYCKELEDVPQQMRELLEKYSNISPERVSEHICSFRDKAWEIWPYPCIGGFRFLSLNLCTTAQYPEVISRLKGGEKLLDMGCFFGQESRRLVFDGAPSENIYAVDSRQKFFELGYQFFLDQDRLKTNFLAADLFESKPELEALNGTISIVYAGSIFHLFDLTKQRQLVKRTVEFLAPQPGSLVLGRQVGDVNAGLYQHVTNGSGSMFRHNEQSWRKLWDDVGKDTGSKWEVCVELKLTKRFMKRASKDEHAHDGARQMYFSCRRL